MARVEVKVSWQDSSEGEKEEQKCTLVELQIAVGSKVKKGEPVAVVETEKATVEIYSPASGEITETMLKAGEETHYGAVLCIIETN
ncbi:MAG: dehydrogenase catalytic domain-containing protein [Candidatus Giovannonibacteria bacterium GW2011_GWA2_44_13b]|uniref:Dehydrogenase catalytic domain-containing protein n=2 Tax=Candidatus Giovannoniibacteriota TaxID=1752738 RepID=A0A0G1K2T8_9BACT|nr:MAG: dehydrogenase catalytic domain-containing protein [Candidatus Giovannonibacteria bacterium GW2011_GWA2_44_13b]OGF81576.1 MAG: hypothetical protein A2924_02405 [Candidatus Giovannonibacteria bacterium RIFCSPLOWO2_01_FULL_44_16]